MVKKFKELRDKMTPESRKRTEEIAQTLRARYPASENAEVGSSGTELDGREVSSLQRDIPTCQLCGKSVHEASGFLQRVNEKGVPAIWECRPNCEAPFNDAERLGVAIFGDAQNFLAAIVDSLHQELAGNATTGEFSSNNDSIVTAIEKLQMLPGGANSSDQL